MTPSGPRRSQRIESLISGAIAKRSALFVDPRTTCFRLVNGAGDGLDGITLDWYDGFILAQQFAPQLDGRIERVIISIDAAARDLPAPVRGVLLKRRLGATGGRDPAAAAKSALVEGEWPPEGFTVLQNGIRATVDLADGQNTGIFLDMREVRERLTPYCRPGATVLNLFSYTALFSVHAIARGASAAVNVDLSRTALQRARVNYGLNGLRVDDRDFIRGDSLEWARRFGKKGAAFSLVIFDPPTFARNRRRTFSTKRNYRGALDLVGGCVYEGHVLTAVNSLSISAAEYRSFHPAGWKLEFLAHEPSDFTRDGTPYLKAGLWRIKKS